MQMKHIEYNRITNCINCGAPLQGTKCGYCNTEYHLDDLGRLKEYYIKLEIFGQITEFYIGTMEVRHDNYETFRNLDGRVSTIKTGPPTIELNLISTGRVFKDEV